MWVRDLQKVYLVHRETANLRLREQRPSPISNNYGLCVCIWALQTRRCANCGSHECHFGYRQASIPNAADCKHHQRLPAEHQVLLVDCWYVCAVFVPFSVSAIQQGRHTQRVNVLALCLFLHLSSGSDRFSRVFIVHISQGRNTHTNCWHSTFLCEHGAFQEQPLWLILIEKTTGITCKNFIFADNARAIRAMSHTMFHDRASAAVSPLATGVPPETRFRHHQHCCAAPNNGTVEYLL